MTEPLAEITLVPQDDGPLIRVAGEVDMANAEAIGRQIREAAGTASPVTLDLGPVTFFDSSALHMLQQVSGEFDRGGGELTVVVAPDSIVGRLLAITHLDDYLHISGRPTG